MQAPLGTRITCLPNMTCNRRPAFAEPAATFPLHDVRYQCRLRRSALTRANLHSLSGYDRALTRRRWWRRTGSNRRPDACKATALPAELRPLIMVGLGRLERPTSPLSGVRSNHLSYRPQPVARSTAVASRNSASSDPAYPDEKEKRGRPLQVPPIEALTGLHVSNDAAKGANS